MNIILETVFDVIIFNFPHCGVRPNDAKFIQKNQGLLHGFFQAASEVKRNQLKKVFLTSNYQNHSVSILESFSKTFFFKIL